MNTRRKHWKPCSLQLHAMFVHVYDFFFFRCSVTFDENDDRVIAKGKPNTNSYASPIEGFMAYRTVYSIKMSLHLEW